MPSARRSSLLLPLLLAISLAACRGTPPESGAKSYPVKGRVVAVDPAQRKLTIDHEEIVGFMPAMTMSFVVREKDAALLDGVTPGDEVTARLVVPDSRYWIEDLVVIEKATPDPNATPPPPDTGTLQPGESVPNVTLVEQDGDEIRLSDYRGRALALTFVFTRCPLPDFCPLMMKKFAAAHARLIEDDGLRGRTHLLTVSFDTKHDTPEVLRRFGLPFQKTTPPFTQWELATGSEEAIRALGGALGLDYVEESRTFTHNLRTAVIDPQGRLARLFRGNEWSPKELVSALESALEV